MPIANNPAPADKDIFYTESFKTLVRSEKESLRNSAQLQIIQEPHVLNAYRNDFYRLLRHYGIGSHLYWANAYINNIENPTADISKMVSFLVLNEASLSAAIARSNTTQG